MTAWARREREALCDLLEEVGADHPTLCEGWTTYDLAVHLVVREGRPDAGIGMIVPGLSGYTDGIYRRTKEGNPYPRLIARIRTGPPAWSPFRLLDEQANTVEYFVHHEDVRRAAPGWTERDLDPAFTEKLWGRLAMAKLLLRKAPVGVVLREPGGRGVVARGGEPSVTVEGPAAELVLWAFGRKKQAKISYDGPAEAVERLRAATWGI
ncbi:MAG: TIGR03085 family protein [Streptosporangiales bacterium]|nr:TIGR03085 family protein [Streptosporangiales bacterium]